MDAFFASIEQRDNPSLRGKPIAVGSSEARGVVSAASYEARRYGVHSAMSSKVAIRKCPHLIFVPHHFAVYKAVSQEIMSIFNEYTDLVEPLSLDEAFLDVTYNHKQLSSATDIAEEIRAKILARTGLTASAGISYNKFLAKIASDCNKPNGSFVIKPNAAERFVENLPIERFFGVGRVTAQKMHQVGIRTGLDLKNRSMAELIHLFGKSGQSYYLNARAIDERPVEANRERKSVGSEETFAEDTDSFDALLIAMEAISRDVIESITRNSFRGRTVTLKIKYADFKSLSRSKTFLKSISDYNTLYNIGIDLLHEIDLTPKIRLLGLSIKRNERVSHEYPIQLSLDFKE